MSVFLVANPKGGVGKSTLATNLAGLLAARHPTARVVLGDADRQQSAGYWLQCRPKAARPIHPLLADEPQKTDFTVLDSSAALQGDGLKSLVKCAGMILVPMSASPFDLIASQAFLAELAELKAARAVKIGLVGMRIIERSHATDHFLRFIESTQLPLVTCLRSTQNYVQLAAHGLTLFDVPPGKVAKDLAQWEALEQWIGVSKVSV